MARSLTRFGNKQALLLSLLLASLLAGGILGGSVNPAWGRSAFTPWTMDMDFQNLVYGASTTVDVHKIVGTPDEIIRTEQMYPVIENYYYFEEGGSGAATVFVFENGLLVGLFVKSGDNNYIDITYFLPNNGDRIINMPIMGQMQGWFPNFPMYTW
jgi:hypothetical protein